MTSVDSRRPAGHKHRLDIDKGREATGEIPRDSRPRRGRWAFYTAIAAALLLVAAGTVTSPWWLARIRTVLGSSDLSAALVDEHDHAADDSAHETLAGEDVSAHSHAGHDEATSLDLSPQGRQNTGLTLATIALQDFARTISMPATLIGRPGQTEIAVSAPMTGIVTRIHPIRGEAVAPGAPLFDLRLTHEDLVEKQSSLLRWLEELDVVEREVARLADITASGAVAGKRLLEREYEQQKTEAAIRAEKQALLLHGLTQQQIAQIVESRQLVQKLSIMVPPLNDCKSCEEHVELLQVAELSVKLGEHVATGTPLATLTDHCELHVEGKAFEQDAEALNRAARAGAEVTAVIDFNGVEKREVTGLRILYVENQVEQESRALKFYVRLPNELVRNEQTDDGHRFIGWRYKPGQRVELLVPIERWEQRIVLPVEAVIQEGPESYVYQEIQGHFDRKPVHVEYRDQRFAVIERDGSLFPGDKVAVKGAFQMHLALKNKSSGGPDPHAGHHH